MEDLISSMIDLDKDEIEILIQISEKITADPTAHTDRFCKQSKILSVEIPERIRNKLHSFIQNGSDTGFLLFRGLAVESIPNTPPGNTYHIGEQTRLARIQSILISAIGEMVAYEAEGYGRLFQDVVPISTMATEQTSLGSHMELEIHTEQAFSNIRPDILSLACLRTNPSAFTYILPVHRIIENCTTEEIERLKMPLWKTGVDLSFKLNGHEFVEGDVRGPLSILNGSTEDPFLLFDQDLMEGITPEAEQMITHIVNIYYKHRTAHCLMPGEIILVDNRRAVHGRSPFYPNYDGFDRFLIRCFATLNYDKSEYAREYGGRVISAIYS